MLACQPPSPRTRRGPRPARKGWRWPSRSADGCPRPFPWPPLAQPEPPEGAAGTLSVSAREPPPGRRAPSPPPAAEPVTSRGWGKSQWCVARARSKGGVTKWLPRGRGRTQAKYLEGVGGQSDVRFARARFGGRRPTGVRGATAVDLPVHCTSLVRDTCRARGSVATATRSGQPGRANTELVRSSVVWSGESWCSPLQREIALGAALLGDYPGCGARIGGPALSCSCAFPSTPPSHQRGPLFLKRGTNATPSRRL